MSTVNISEIGNEFFLARTKEKDFHRNIYFKRFRKNENTVNMIFDPGTRLDSDIIIESAKKLFGSIQNIDIIFLSHQDPDVSSLTPVIMASAKKSVLITSVDTFRLVSMYGISEPRVFLIENFNSEMLTIKKTGHKIRFVPAYFCHFRGATMFYDYESKILISGDFAAGVNTRNGNGFFADEESWEGIKVFHTIYMPNSLAVKETINRIGLLNPLPDIIAPQHGDLINSDLLLEFLTRLDNLEVGIDYIKTEEPQKDLFMDSLAEFINRIKKSYPDEWEKLKKALNKPGQFTTVYKVTMDTIIDIKIDPTDALSYLIGLIESSVNPSLVDEIKTLLNFELENHNLMLPLAILSKLRKPDESKDDGFEKLIR